MSRIFISYRRRESSKDAIGLFERLARDFGSDAVFMDVEGIALGVDFQEVLDRTLDTCSVMVLLIGPDWAELKDESGARRLDDPNDFVRIEVATALRRKIPLIPVFVDGARMPRSDRLPADLAALPRRQGMPLDHINWRAQTAQLVGALTRWLQPQQGSADTPPQRQPGAVFRDAPDTPEMVVIPAGEFMMGSPESEEGRTNDEGPQHRVVIARPFAVGRYAVTFDEWDACVAAGGCSHKPDDAGWGRGRRPVIDVSWEDAQAYKPICAGCRRRAARTTGCCRRQSGNMPHAPGRQRVTRGVTSQAATGGTSTTRAASGATSKPRRWVASRPMPSASAT